MYVSAVSGLPLFDSSNKYDSGSGWPSFWLPFDPAHIALLPDNSHGMQRIEVIDAKSQAHIRHVFNDGPKPTRMRFCMNGASLKFVPRNEFNQMYSDEYLQLRKQHFNDFIQETTKSGHKTKSGPHDEL